MFGPMAARKRTRIKEKIRFITNLERERHPLCCARAPRLLLVGHHLDERVEFVVQHLGGLIDFLVVERSQEVGRLVIGYVSLAVLVLIHEDAERYIKTHGMVLLKQLLADGWITDQKRSEE